MYKSLLVGILISLSLSACITYAPLIYNPKKIAYAILDEAGNPSKLCFDTISPNNCINANNDEIKKYNLKQRLKLQQIIVILGEPSQIDCNIYLPVNCRVYFDHIHIDMIISPNERETLEKEIQKINI